MPQNIFQHEEDLAGDIGEDVTREALDRMGMPRIDQRLFGKVDYKRACYLFHPDYAIKQALFVDSKAEKIAGAGTATLQLSQLSLEVRQYRNGQVMAVPGLLPHILTLRGEDYITTTLFVKYNYEKIMECTDYRALPLLPCQMAYCKIDITQTTMVRYGMQDVMRPPSENLRVRLSFAKLKHIARWRVQTIPISPHPFVWAD